MNPVVGTIGGYPVYVYAVLLDAGVVAGVGLAAWLASRRGVPVLGFLDAALWALGAAFVGARLQYVLAHWAEYAPRPANAVNVWEGGLALPGAITAGALAAWAALRVARLPVGRALDASAPALALGQSIGRLGCVAAGCAFGATLAEGSIVPALPLPDAGGAVALRFPSQVAEAAAELVLAGLLLALWWRDLRPGAIAAAYLVGYGLVRLLAEPWRGDSTYWGPMPLAQIWAVAAAATGAAWLVTHARRWGPAARRAPSYARE